MPVQVKVDVSQALNGLHELEQSQIPFALAKTLTGVAQDAQIAVKEQVAKAFKNRNTWTAQGVRIQPASKRGGEGGVISASVFTDTANRTTGAPDYLGRQETGGEKVPYGGRSHIAVPTKYLRQIAPAIIPAELRPAALLSVVGGRYSTKTRKGQIAIKQQVLGRGTFFFVVTLKDGNSAIMARAAFDSRDAAVPLYLLIREATIRRSGLEMEATVQRVAESSFATRWEENWRQIRLSGIRI